MALNDGIASNMYHGVLIGSDIHLSHLFYVDDVIILSDWNQNDMKNITRILNIFYTASGLKINFNKSNVFGVGVSNSEVVSMAACTGCEADSFPLSYLGLPIGSNMSRIANCHESSKKLSWVKWSNILASFDNGGLGVGSLSAFNRALLLKWRWRLFDFSNSLWVQVIKAFHGNEADRLPNRLNLSSRGLDIDSISCMVCNGHVESNDHIFFTCDTTVAISNLVRSWIDLPLLSFLSCEDWTNWFDSCHVSKDKKSRMYSIFATTCWSLWRFRNNTTFNSHSMRKCDIFDFIRNVSFSWLKYRGGVNQVIDWVTGLIGLGLSGYRVRSRGLL
nr:RNA-directed DNA polymerase, eukaryota, reverse transcriptase zinc-binding domain protein [Tanacetum cinerariifolium]